MHTRNFKFHIFDKQIVEYSISIPPYTPDSMANTALVFLYLTVFISWDVLTASPGTRDDLIARLISVL